MSKSGDEFITKDSGERVQWSTGMQRDTTKGKQLWSLLIPLLIPFKQTMLYRWVMLLTRGAEKYASRNWEQARTPEELERFKDSAFRHFMQWFNGETDEDHAAAVFFNINGAEYVKSRLKYDGATAATPTPPTIDREKVIQRPSSTYRPTIPTKPATFGELYDVGRKYSYTGEPEQAPKTSHKLITPNGVTEWNPPAPSKYRPLGEDEKELLRNGSCECVSPSCTNRQMFDALVNRVVMPLPVTPLLPPEAYDTIIILDDRE